MLSKELINALVQALLDPETSTRLMRPSSFLITKSAYAEQIAQISFDDRDLMLHTKKHNRPLYVTGDINQTYINCILVDPGSAVNLLPLRTLKKVGHRESERKETVRKEKAMEEPKVHLEGVKEAEWPRRGRKKGAAAVKLEGYVEEGESQAAGEDGGPTVGRTKSLTDEDLEELKGCLDLGFGFSYEEIPELCGTLPALELCYSMSQRFLDEQQQRSTAGYHAVGAVSPVRVANWKISNPGDHPDEVKARLKYWAQAVACTVKLCS